MKTDKLKTSKLVYETQKILIIKYRRIFEKKKIPKYIPVRYKFFEKNIYKNCSESIYPRVYYLFKNQIIRQIRD